MVKYSFSRFKNTATEPIMIVLDDSPQAPTVDEKEEEQDNLHEPFNMILDILSSDEPPTMETLPSIITPAKTDEVVEVLMKELSMDDDKKLPNKAGADIHNSVNPSDGDYGKNKGKSPIGDERKPKKLKSEPSVNDSNQGKYAIVTESSPRCTRSPSRLRHVASGSSCKAESPSEHAKGAYVNHNTSVKLEGCGDKDCSWSVASQQ